MKNNSSTDALCCHYANYVEYYSVDLFNNEIHEKFLTRNYDDRHSHCRLFKDESTDKFLTKFEKKLVMKKHIT